MSKCKFRITYWFDGKHFDVVTKECTIEQAERAFNEDLNTLGEFDLVSIIPDEYFTNDKLDPACFAV